MAVAEEEKPVVQLLVPEWIKSASCRSSLGEGEVVRIPESEFADPDFVVEADDFPAEPES